MITIIRILLKITLAITIALVSALWWIQEDPWFIAKLEAQIENVLKDSIGSGCICKIKRLNLFTGYVLFDYSKVNPQSNNWSIKCPRTLISISWFDWLLSRDFKAQITFFNPEIFSTYQNGALALYEPIKNFMESPSTWLTIESVALRHAELGIKSDFDFKYKLNFSADLYMRKAGCSILTSFNDGLAYYNDKEIFNSLKGSISLFINFDGYLQSGRGQVGINTSSNILNKQTLNLNWDHSSSKGSFVFYTPDRVYSIKGGYKKNDKNWSIACDFKMPLLLEYKFPISFDIDGQIQAQYSNDQKFTYNFNVKTPNLSLNDNKLCKILAKGQGDLDSLNGNLKFKDYCDRMMNGTWHVNLSKKSGHLSLKYNKSLIDKKADFDKKIENYDYNVDPGKSFLNLKINENIFSSNWQIEGKLLDQSGNGNTKVFSGKLLYPFNKGQLNNNPVVEACGTFDSYKYELKFDPYSLKIDKLTVENIDKNALENTSIKKAKPKKLIAFDSKTSNLTCGLLDWDIIKKIVETVTGQPLYGNGKLNCCFKPFKDDFRLKFVLKDGTVRLPNFYNMLTGGSGTFHLDLENRQILLRNFNVNLHRGICKSSLCTFGFSNSGQLCNAHMPFVFGGCFLNWHKDFFGIFSGELTLQGFTTKSDQNKSEDAKNWKCSGQITLDQSHLKTNLLSNEIKKCFEPNRLVNSLIHSDRDVQLDINLITKQPLTVKTEFLNATAKVDISINKTLFDPLVSGIINLESGALNFPYKKLFITSGKLILNGTNPEEIAIELTAVNTVKKYPITMTVRGTLSDPLVSFEAPGLKQEQIITLLLSGSEDGSLYWAMPRMAMQYLHTLIFGSAEDYVSLGALKSLFTGLKKVRIVPKSNSSDNNLFEGALEVDITDRLHAKVQNDLSLSKDTAVEVEYTLSDEMSIRAVRDAQAVGGEINMHWKFP